MNLKNIDLEWVVVSQSSTQGVFSTLVENAKNLGWTISEMKNVDEAQNTLTVEACEAWPQETSGSLLYSKEENGVYFSVFWNTFEAGGLSKISGGLYIHQHHTSNLSFMSVCKIALADMHALFETDECFCVVINFEDDLSLDVAPGIVGRYQSSLWESFSSNKVFLVEPVGDSWLEVSPIEVHNLDGDLSLLPELSQESLLTIQAELEKGFWG